MTPLRVLTLLASAGRMCVLLCDYGCEGLLQVALACQTEHCPLHVCVALSTFKSCLHFCQPITVLMRTVLVLQTVLPALAQF